MNRWDNLSLQEKNQLLGIYASKGYTDLASIISHYNTFQDGGSVDNKSDWAKAHETELALHQLGWDNPDNKLHSDYAVKDDNGYYAGYNLKPVTVSAKHPIKDIEPDIKADRKYWDDLYQQYLRREEAGKEYLKNIGRVGLTIGTLPLLGYGLAAAPLTTGLSLAGGEGLNYGINKLTPYNSWGNMLAEGVFNTDNELAQTALEFTNPGFLLGPKVTPFVNNQYRGLRVANELRRGIRNTELQPRVVKNTAHTRTKLGDVEIDDPNLMYHVDNGDYTGFSGNGAYVKDGLLFPTQNESGQTPYTWWNLGRPYRDNQSRLLTVVKDNPNLLKVRDQNYPIGQWTGNPTEKSFVTNSEYVSSKPIKIGNQYEYIPDYGYRRIQKSIPTLEQAYQEATNTAKSVFNTQSIFGPSTENPLWKKIFNLKTTSKPDLNVPNYWDRFSTRVKSKYGNEVFDNIDFVQSNTVEDRIIANKAFQTKAEAIAKELEFINENPKDVKAATLRKIKQGVSELPGFQLDATSNIKTNPLVYTTNNAEIYALPKVRKIMGDAVDKWGKNLTQNNLIKPHETAHALPRAKEPITKDMFDFNNLEDYLVDRNFEEIKARGTQLKDYFNKDNITAKDLQYAANHYVKDIGMDNNMTEMFSRIKDWDKMAKWITKYSPALVLPVMVGTSQK